MGYKYKVNHHYFDEIDSEYKAYILGFIYADGSVSQPKGNRQLALTISLQEEDGYILEKLSQDACGGNFRIENPPSSSKRGFKKRATVRISSDILCKRLISLGCIQNKSRDGMTFPNLPKEFEKDFVRGFLDGDGSVIFQKNRQYKYVRKTTYAIPNPHRQRYRLRVAFSSTDKKFLEKIAEVLGIIKPYIATKLRKQLNHILWIENRTQVLKSLEFLYSKSTYFLERKYNSFKTFKETIKSQAKDTSLEGLETT